MKHISRSIHISFLGEEIAIQYCNASQSDISVVSDVKGTTTDPI